MLVVFDKHNPNLCYFTATAFAFSSKFFGEQLATSWIFVMLSAVLSMGAMLVVVLHLLIIMLIVRKSRKMSRFRTSKRKRSPANLSKTVVLNCVLALMTSDV